MTFFTGTFMDSDCLPFALILSSSVLLFISAFLYALFASSSASACFLSAFFYASSLTFESFVTLTTASEVMFATIATAYPFAFFAIFISLI